MSTKMDLLREAILIFAFIVNFCATGVSAFDAGDATALVLGLVIGSLAICSCLGYYARRRDA